MVSFGPTAAPAWRAAAVAVSASPASLSGRLTVKPRQHLIAPKFGSRPLLVLRSSSGLTPQPPLRGFRLTVGWRGTSSQPPPEGDATPSCPSASAVDGDVLRALAGRIAEDPEFAARLAKRPSARALLEDAEVEERAVTEEIEKSAFGTLRSNAPPPDNRQLFLYSLTHFIPFIGFGFCDNAVMIIAGDYIDAHLGLAFGLTTMAAAAMGNTFSNVVGLWVSGVIETFTAAMGLPDHRLTNAQQSDLKVRILKNCAMIIGIIVGCVLGMFPLVYPKEWRVWESRVDREAVSD